LNVSETVHYNRHSYNGTTMRNRMESNRKGYS